jgi:hypothetical protein
MNVPVEKLLARLQSVRQRGDGKWFACCPAHDDGRPSLSIQETTDGTVLLHCFAGCGAGDVCAAVGLSLSDLFVQRQSNDERLPHRRHRPQFSAKDLLHALDHESLIIANAACNVAAGRAISAEEMERLKVARDRITRILEVVR